LSTLLTLLQLYIATKANMSITDKNITIITSDTTMMNRVLVGILKRSGDFLLCTTKETNCVLLIRYKCVRALGPCLLLLQSA